MCLLADEGAVARSCTGCASHDDRCVASDLVSGGPGPPFLEVDPDLYR